MITSPVIYIQSLGSQMMSRTLPAGIQNCPMRDGTCPMVFGEGKLEKRNNQMPLNYRPIETAQCLPFNGGNTVHAMRLWECKKQFYRTSYQSRISQYAGADFEEPSWNPRNALWVGLGRITGAWQLFTAESSIPNVLLAPEKWSKLANHVVPVNLCAFNFANFFPLFSVCGSGGRVGDSIPVMFVVLWYEGIRIVQSCCGRAFTETDAECR